MTILDALKQIGIEYTVFIAGMSGAITLLTKNKKMTYSQKFLTVLSGGLSANYLAPLVVKLLNVDNGYLGGFGFVIGLAGLKGVEFIITEIYLKYKK